MTLNEALEARSLRTEPGTHVGTKRVLDVIGVLCEGRAHEIWAWLPTHRRRHLCERCGGGGCAACGGVGWHQEEGGGGEKP